MISVINQQILQNVNQSWQTLANPANTVDYSSHLLSATLPISIQHFLKYSETIKKETVSGSSAINSGNLNLGSSGGGSGGGGVGGLMDPSSVNSGFNIKSDLINLKNGIGTNLNLALSGGTGGGVGGGVGIGGGITGSGGGIMGLGNSMTGPGLGINNHGMEQTNIVEATTTTGKKKKKKASKVIGLPRMKNIQYIFLIMLLTRLQRRRRNPDQSQVKLEKQKH